MFPVWNDMMSTWSCGACNKSVTKRQWSILCKTCECWLHKKCTNLTTEEIKHLENQNWTCIECLERQCPRLVYPESPGHISSNWPGSTLIQGGDKNGGKHGEPRRRHAAGNSPCSIEDSNPDRFWTNLNQVCPEPVGIPPETERGSLDIVHWKPIFFNIFKNKTSELFLKCLETKLRPLAENTNHHEMSMKAAMVLPHLILGRTTDRRDGSVKKATAKTATTLDKWRLWQTFGRAMPYRNELERNENYLWMRRRNSTDKWIQER